jgi:hypothetical protein
MVVCIYFDRVVREVLEIADNDLILMAMKTEGLDTVADLLALTDSQIDGLSFVDDAGAKKFPSLAPCKSEQDPYPLVLEPVFAGGPR